MNMARTHSEQLVRADPPIILLVEDDLLVRSIVAASLRDSGLEVIEANGADEALRVLQAEVPVDLVFSDINMPGSIDGVGLAQWLRRERPRAALILTSGTSPTDLNELGSFLAKPYDIGELERRIRALLAP
jgi:DNA-binding response OmpR family regulator